MSGTVTVQKGEWGTSLVYTVDSLPESGTLDIKVDDGSSQSQLAVVDQLTKSTSTNNLKSGVVGLYLDGVKIQTLATVTANPYQGSGFDTGS